MSRSATQKQMTVTCDCGWKGFRNPKTKGILLKSCPKCGGNVRRRQVLQSFQGAAKKRLKNSLPEDRQSIIVRGKFLNELSLAVIDDTCDLIEKGNFPQTAAMASGIPAKHFGAWMVQGQRDWNNDKDTLQARFYLHVQQATAIGEVRLIELGLTKTENNQSTWMGAYRHLESFSRERWLKTQEVNINSHQKIEHSIDVPPEPPKSHAEWLERKKAREIEAEFEVIEETT